jgi:outer membrane protein TolC
MSLHPRLTRLFQLCITPALALAASFSGAARAAEKVPLKLQDYLRLVVAQNETIQAQLFASESTRRRALAENGAFEPEWVSTAQRQANHRPNTVEQQRNLAGVPVLDERNNLFDSGIEGLTQTGAKVRLGYTLNNFNNNLKPLTPSGVTGPDRSNEWQSFAGVTLTQPLLKNGGTTAALAALRLAAINSESSFQEYRRQLMVTLSQGESAYWAVYFAQEQLRFLQESVGVAETILSDSRVKVKAGKGSELDVLEAEAGLALRHTKRTEARQKASESMAQLLVLAGESPSGQNTTPYLIVDEPDTALPALSYDESWRSAVESNPDYLIQKKKLDEALVRYAFARNQRLPELNLKASYGYNGLGDSAQESWSEVTDHGFRSWSVGGEFRLPLGGGIRGRNELAAMDATVRQVQLQLHGMETQLGNALNTSIQKLRHTRANVDDYDTMVRFNQKLLEAERDRLGVGKVEARHVLEVEAGLFEVRQGLADARVQIKRATLELYLAEGSTLKRKNLDFTPADLREQTRILLSKPPRKSGKPAATPAAYVPPKLLLKERAKPHK